MKDEKGSVILETALVFPFVLLIMLAFSVLIRYFVVYETVQHGMYETTREMSAYYYLYATSGLEETANAISKEKEEAEGNLDMLAEPFNVTIGNIKSIANGLKSAHGTASSIDLNSISREKVDELDRDVKTIIDGIKGTTSSLQDCKAAIELIMESPLETMTYLIKYAAGEAIAWGQNSVMNLIGQALLTKHIPGKDLIRYTEAYGISDMHTAMAWNVEQSGDVEMVTTYKFTIRLFGGYDFWVTQRTRARGWGLGV